MIRQFLLVIRQLLCARTYSISYRIVPYRIRTATSNFLTLATIGYLEAGVDACGSRGTMPAELTETRLSGNDQVSLVATVYTFTVDGYQF